MRPCPVFTLYYTRAHPPFLDLLPCHRASFHSLELIFFLSLSLSLLSHRVYFTVRRIYTYSLYSHTPFLSLLFVPNFNNLEQMEKKERGEKRKRNIPQEVGSESIVRNNRGEIQSFLSPRRDESGGRGGGREGERERDKARGGGEEREKRTCRRMVGIQ